MMIPPRLEAGNESDMGEAVSAPPSYTTAEAVAYPIARRH